MKVVLAPGWKTELDRGPDWLFVKLYGPNSDEADATGMAESLSMLLRQEFKRRMVLELDGLVELPQDFLDELMLLHDTLSKQGALLRLCGMSNEHQEMLCENDLSGQFNSFRDRAEAVLGFYRPSKPR